MIVRQTHTRAAARTAFTLMEMLVVVAIIVTLAGVGGYYYLKQADEAKKSAAKAQVKTTLTNAVKTYYLDHSAYPDSLQALLVRSADGKGPYLEEEDAIYDPWGQPYQYDKSGQHNHGTRPDIFTTGPDGSTIGNWSDRSVAH
jgi:general secretion pathway protein G